MNVLQFSAGREKHRVNAIVIICGTDLNVCICGGTHHHIGACALGIPRSSLKDRTKTSASVSVFTAVGHKEDDLARHATHHLTTIFGCRVTVSAGLHIDNATQEDIQLLEHNFWMVLSDVEKQVCDVVNVV